MEEVDKEDKGKKEKLITPSQENNKINNLELDKNKEVKEAMQLKIDEPKNIDIDYYGSANCISSLLYYWAFKIIKLSHKVKITIQHLGTLKGNHSSYNFMKHYYYIYNELDYKSKGLVQSIFRSNLGTIILVLILGLCSTGVNVVQMMIFKQYVAMFKEDSIHTTEFMMFVYFGVGF